MRNVTAPFDGDHRILAVKKITLNAPVTGVKVNVMGTFKELRMIIGFIIAIYCTTGCGTSSYVSYDAQYENPPWAPPYYHGVRYYYLPDIEVYYDLTDDEFVYLDNGQWLFSPALPAMYASYDLYNGFVIALNAGVYRPWMHHQYYVSHYPRYYYHNTYHGRDISGIRGFNENDHKSFNRAHEDRSSMSRLNNPPPAPKTERKMAVPMQPQNTNYYGRIIGQPVKVKPQMRDHNHSFQKKGH